MTLLKAQMALAALADLRAGKSEDEQAAKLLAKLARGIAMSTVKCAE